MNRNYAAEMRAVFDAETASGEYAVPLVAAHIVDKLRASDPDLLAGWLDANAVSFVGEALSTRDRSARSHARSVAKRGVFGKAAKEATGGDPARLSGFLALSYVVADDNLRKPLWSMTSADCSFVARAYESDAKAARFEAQWMRAIGKKIPTGKTVGDVFTEGQVAAMRASIGGRAA